MEMALHLLMDFTLAFFVACCWGILFGTPFKALWMAGLLGGVGHSVRFMLLQAGIALIPATLVASVLIGLSAIFSAHKVHNPPVVLTMPACITMIPGLYAYRSMLAIIKLSDMTTINNNMNIIPDIAHNVVLTFALLFTLAVGISISALLFRNKSVKEIRFDKKWLSKKDKR